MIVAFDVETIPNPASEREDAALVPPLAVPISVAFAHPDGDHVVYTVEDKNFDLLVANAFEVKFSGILVSFNGRSYDIPVLVHWMALRGLAIPKILKTAFQQKRWEFRPHCDLREAMCGSGLYSSGTLHDYCIAYGIESPKKNCSGDKVQDMYKEGRFKEIAEYNLADAIATFKLYQKWRKAWE